MFCSCDHGYSEFADIAGQLDGLLTKKPTVETLQQLSQEIVQLRKSLVDGTDLLPAYDQRQCEAVGRNASCSTSPSLISAMFNQQMTALEAQLESIRSSATAKPKFSFQRKTNTSSASASGPSKQGITALQVPSTQPASTFYTLQKHAHQYLTSTALPPPTAGQPQSDLTISDLDHCIVNLCSWTSQSQSVSERSWSHELTALHIRNLRSTIVILPNISGSILLHGLERCVILASCHQVKTTILCYSFRRDNDFGELVPNAYFERCRRISEYTLKPYHRALHQNPSRWVPILNRSINLFRRRGQWLSSHILMHASVRSVIDVILW